MRIGAHVSVAGSLEAAAQRAHRIGANTLQIFTSSPRSWRASTPAPDAARRFTEARRRLDLAPLVVHVNYLVNLAAADPEIRRKSIASFRAELERALLVEADYLVAHPGSFRGQPPEQAIARLAEALAEAARGIRSPRLTLLWESTAGQGNSLGATLEELGAIGERTRPHCDFAVGYCLDTAHLAAAGYDILTARGLRSTLQAADRLLGLHRVPVIHTNDSKTPPGSRVDRHEHIGKGYIGEEAFRRILTHRLLRPKAFILETPLENDEDDARNIATLKRLCRRSPTTTT